MEDNFKFSGTPRIPKLTKSDNFSFTVDQKILAPTKPKQNETKFF